MVRVLDVETLLECIFDAVKNRVKIPAVSRTTA